MFPTSAGANQVCDHGVCIYTCTTTIETATQKQQTEHSTRMYISRAGKRTAPEADSDSGPVQVFLLPLNGRWQINLRPHKTTWESLQCICLCVCVCVSSFIYTEQFRGLIRRIRVYDRRDLSKTKTQPRLPLVSRWSTQICLLYVKGLCFMAFSCTANSVCCNMFVYIRF